MDEAAVASFLSSGRLAGYATDAFKVEDRAVESRPREVNPLLLADRNLTLFTPHIGSAVGDVWHEIAMEAALNIVDVLQGRRSRGAINEVESRVAKPGHTGAAALTS